MPFKPAINLGGPWQIEAFGPCKLIRPSSARLRALDESWVQLRSASSDNAHWKWETLAADASECFALVSEDHEVAGLWAGKPKVQVASRKLYRLDYIEVHPIHRGALLGALTLSLAAKRALSAGCDLLALHSVAGAKGFYERMQGIERRIPGWPCPKDLITYVFEDESLKALAEFENEFLPE